MNKIYKILLIVFALVFPLSLIQPVSAESSINSYDLTWSVYNPAGYIYYVTSNKIDIDLDNDLVVNLINQNIATNSSTRVTVTSVLDSYSQSIVFSDLVSYNYNWFFLEWLDNFSGYGTSTDYQVQFQLVIYNQAGITSSSLALNYVNTNFGLYDDIYFTFVSREDMLFDDAYSEGYLNGYDIGVIDGYDDGFDNGVNDLYDNGSVYYDLPLNSSDDYLSGYDDGYELGSGISFQDFNVWSAVWSFFDGLFAIALFPGLTIGGLFGIGITVPLAFWMLKFFKKG